MAIGRTEDRDTPRNPLMLRHRVYVQDPIRATHLGQRSPTAHTGRTHDRNRPDPSRQLHKILATRGPSTHGFRARRCAAPRNDGVIYGLLCKAGWRPAMTDYLGSGILGAAQGQSAREVPMASFPLVSATGMLGSGYRAESLDTAIELGARMIGCDAGSTDPGPGPLATGTCMFSKAAVKRDTEIMMTRAVKAGIPLIIGSAGTSGSDAGLAWMVDIVHQIAREQDLRFKLAVIHSELSQRVVRRYLRAGRARALPPSAPLTDADIDEATRIVGMMGVE